MNRFSSSFTAMLKSGGISTTVGQESTSVQGSTSAKSSKAISNTEHATKTISVQLSQRVLGTGSFSVVYKAQMSQVEEDKENQSSAALVERTPPFVSIVVAVKVVNRERMNRKLQQRLNTEIQIMRTIRHPNIIQLLDIQERNHEMWIVMDYCDLGDLSSFIKRQRALKSTAQSSTSPVISSGQHQHTYGLNGLPVDMVWHFLRQLSSALSLLHQKHIIHRDLKPQNLLLCKPMDDGPYPLLKLADFGFARYLQKFDMADTLCGSPLYMAPEILKHEKYDSKADLWSVGTILYEMLTGSPPFKAPNHIALLKKIQNTERVLFPDESRRPSTVIGHLTHVQSQQASQAGSPRSFRSGSFTAPSSLSTNMGVQYDYGSSLPTTGPMTHVLPNGLRIVEDQQPTNGSDALDVLMELKNLARLLLVQRPDDRLSFEEFFAHVLIRGPCCDQGEGGQVKVEKRERADSHASGQGLALLSGTMSSAGSLTMPRPIPDRHSVASSSLSNPPSLQFTTSLRQRPPNVNTTSFSFGDQYRQATLADGDERKPRAISSPMDRIVPRTADAQTTNFSLDSISFPPRAVLSPRDDSNMTRGHYPPETPVSSAPQTPGGAEKPMDGSWLPPFQMDDIAQALDTDIRKEQQHVQGSGSSDKSTALHAHRHPAPPMPFAVNRISPTLIASSSLGRNYRNRQNQNQWSYADAATNVAHYAMQWLQTGLELAKPGIDALWPGQPRVQHAPSNAIEQRNNDFSQRIRSRTSRPETEDDGFVIVDEYSATI